MYRVNVKTQFQISDGQGPSSRDGFFAETHPRCDYLCQHRKICTIQGLTNNKTKKEFIQYKSIDSSSLVESKERNTDKHVCKNT
jgi:hypothetical protein